MIDLTAEISVRIDQMAAALSQQVDRLAKASPVMPRFERGDEPKAEGTVLPTDKPSQIAKDEVPMAKPPTRASTPASPSHSLKKAGPVGALRDRAHQRQIQSHMAVDAYAAHQGAAPAAPKLSQEDQARRAAEFAAFTPASSHAEAPHQGSHGGELELAREPKARSLASVRKAAAAR